MSDHERAYVCIHVFERTRPVLLVSRTEGDWCLLCGDPHPDDAAAYRVVGIGHILDGDPTLEATLDLPENWEAERSAIGQPWSRRPIDSEDNP